MKEFEEVEELMNMGKIETNQLLGEV